MPSVKCIVKDDEEATITLSIDLTVHHEDVVVSAGVSPQSVADIAQSVVVLDERELAQKIAPTLGETLAQEPGVQQTQYAPGASRPIIRGLGGDRIRILQDGIGAGDASNVSTDHAVSIDPYSADRIEVVRGAATLLYGSNAVGGVVNVLDHRIPDHRTDHKVTGDVNLRYGTVNEIESGAVDVGGTAGAFGWNLDYSKATVRRRQGRLGLGICGRHDPQQRPRIAELVGGCVVAGREGVRRRRRTTSSRPTTAAPSRARSAST